MIIKDKILCGSSELFKHIKNFKPADLDYIIVSDSDETFNHYHPEENICHFIWGSNKEEVRKFLLTSPYYMTVMSLVTKPFIDAYEFSLTEVTQIIDRFYKVYQNSVYRYYVPLFDYIKSTGSWEFTEDVLNKSYELYKEFKKR